MQWVGATGYRSSSTENEMKIEEGEAGPVKSHIRARTTRRKWEFSWSRGHKERQKEMRGAMPT